MNIINLEEKNVLDFCSSRMKKIDLGSNIKEKIIKTVLKWHEPS